MLETLQIILFASLILLIFSLEAMLISYVVLVFQTRKKNKKLAEDFVRGLGEATSRSGFAVMPKSNVGN